MAKVSHAKHKLQRHGECSKTNAIYQHHVCAILVIFACKHVPCSGEIELHLQPDSKR